MSRDLARPVQAGNPPTGVPFYRKQKDLSQAALAVASEIEVSRLSRIEAGQLIPTAHEVDRLVDVLETLPTRLFSRHILAEIAERAATSKAPTEKPAA